ncbi:hypothetical protein [Dactylosporangium sp. NPDC006015]|uniref:hypothetical protein n=1 Tax=Dactylosporangium sp. NPDC006015 TaxID=3154576 RepID=UPI0033AF98E4
MIEELIRKTADDDEDAAEELTAIAAADPQRLVPHHHLMLDLDVLWPATLYRGAGADVVSRVVERVDGGQIPVQLNNLLLVLAHTGHPLAEQAMRRWEIAPPVGSDALHLGPLRYAEQAGWTVGPDGSRRSLCGDVAYEWHLRPSTPAADGGTCPWCTSPLWTAADLPDAGDALAHTGWPGRLVVRTCHFCACYTTLYSAVAPDGGSTWWTGNTRPDYIGRDAGPEDPPALLPVMGPQRQSPFQASAWNDGGSTLGGHPEWIQDADHPACPSCGEPMDYIGMLYGGDFDEFGEGAYYLHLHAPCGFAAVNYQQS